MVELALVNAHSKFPSFEKIIPNIAYDTFCLLTGFLFSRIVKSRASANTFFSFFVFH